MSKHRFVQGSFAEAVQLSKIAREVYDDLARSGALAGLVATKGDTDWVAVEEGASARLEDAGCYSDDNYIRVFLQIARRLRDQHAIVIWPIWFRNELMARRSAAVLPS